MDTEISNEVADVSESLQPEEDVMEKEAVSYVAMPKESTEPEIPAAANEEIAVNDHEKQAINLKETDKVVVTEATKTSEEKPGMEIEVKLPREESEREFMEKNDSSEKVSGAAAALHTEAESEPGNVPEPILVQAPLVDSAPKLEPLKSVETAPESQSPTSQEEELAPVMGEAPPQVTKATGAGGDAADTPKENQVKTEANGDGKSVRDEKEVETEAKEPNTGMVADEGAKEEGDKSEKNDMEPIKEEETVPISGSLSFAFLQQEKTKETLRLSRTIVIIRGLPGSGKSFLSRAIADAYQDHCSIICADDHGVKPESPEASADAYNTLDEAVVALCGAATSSPLLMVVDDTNHTQDRLACLAEIAEQHCCVTIFLEPRTEWSRDAAQLSKKTKHGLAEAQIEVMKGHLEETSLPLFFGWFILLPAQEKICCTSMDFLKTLDTLEAFKKHLIDCECTRLIHFPSLCNSRLRSCWSSSTVTEEADKEVDLEQYFKTKGPLHCTTKFCNYGKADGAKEYAQNPVSYYKQTSGLFILH